MKGLVSNIDIGPQILSYVIPFTFFPLQIIIWPVLLAKRIGGNGVKITRLSTIIIFISIFLLLIPQPAFASGSLEVGFTLTTGQAKIIPVFVKKGDILKTSINVLQQSRVEFDLANQEMTVNVVKFGHVGAGDFYYVSMFDYQYNLVVTNTGGSSSTMWGTVSYSVEPSKLPLGTTNGNTVGTPQVDNSGKVIWSRISAPPTSSSSSPLPPIIAWTLISLIWVGAIGLTVYFVTRQYVSNFKTRIITILGLATAITLVILYVFFTEQFVTAMFWIMGMFVLILFIILLSRAPRTYGGYRLDRDSSNSPSELNVFVHTERKCPDCKDGWVDPPPINRVFGIKWKCRRCNGTGRIMG